MNEIKRYVAILNKISRGKAPSNEELQFFAEYSPKIDQAALKKIQDEANSIGLDPDEVNAGLAEAFKIGVSNPDTKQLYIDQAENLSKSKVAEQISGALNTALAVGDIVASTQQISQSKQAGRRSRRPSRPAPMTGDPALDQAIFDAQQGNLNTARRLAPAQQAIMDQYLSDINQAKIASTGQAGAYGALAQVASNRRGRGMGELAAISDQMNTQQQARLDDLIGTRIAQNQAIQQSQAQYYPTELDQYQAEQQAIGNLGAVGRQNLRESLANLGGFVTSTASDLATKNRFRKIRSNLEAYGNLPNGQSVADLGEQADRDLLTRYSMIADPQYLEQIYGAQ